MKKIAEWIRHNQGVFLSVVIMAGLVIWVYGCESKVQSLTQPNIMVNVEELKLEIEAETARLNLEVQNILAQGELRMDQFKKLDEVKRLLINFAAITADAQTVNPAGVVSLLFTILGIGAVIDNRLKDKVISNRPLKVE